MYLKSACISKNMLKNVMLFIKYSSFLAYLRNFSNPFPKIIENIIAKAPKIAVNVVGDSFKLEIFRPAMTP